MKDHLIVIGVLLTFAAFVVGVIVSVTFAAICGLVFVVSAFVFLIYVVYRCSLSLVRGHRNF